MSKEKETNPTQVEENTKPAKKDQKGNDTGFFAKIGNWFKKVFKAIGAMFSELKLVTWPKFPTVVKQTGVVLAVDLFFLVIVTGIHFGLAGLLNLLKSISA